MCNLGFFVCAGAAGTAPKSRCSTFTWVIISLVIFVCLLSAVFVLILKMRNGKAGKKTEKGLWTDTMPLKTKS